MIPLPSFPHQQAAPEGSVRPIVLRRVFLRDFELLASVGVHAFEREARQRLIVNLDLGVIDETAEPSGGRVGADDVRRIVDYEVVAGRVRQIVMQEHVQLLETLCERIAQACLEDWRVRSVRVRLEKPDIFKDIGAVGVEIERHA